MEDEAGDFGTQAVHRQKGHVEQFALVEGLVGVAILLHDEHLIISALLLEEGVENAEELKGDLRVKRMMREY
jgi:hypothetical protein